MNMPSVPTDNMYKFLAIAGIALVLGGSYMEISTNRNRVERGYELVQVLRGDIERLHLLAEKDAQFKEQIEAKFTLLKYISEDTSDTADLIRILKESEPSEENKLEHLLLYYDVELWHRQLINLNRDTWFTRILSWILCAIGGIVSTRGFFLWYDRLQKPMDERLANGGE